MKDENKIDYYVDFILLVGLLLFIVYLFFNKFIATVPDILAYPWMISSCILMLIGVFRTGKKLGEHLKK